MQESLLSKPFFVLKFISLLSLSWVIVGFGMAVWSPLLAMVAATIGYGLFWRVLLDITSVKKRFWLSCGWFTAVQLVQLSWFISHPYVYIYALYFFFAGAKGVQFGLVSMFLTQERVRRLGFLFAFAGAWALMEWIRLFFMGGYTLNPLGLALGANIYSLQIASVVGVYGMTFLVVLTNLFFLRLLAGISHRYSRKDGVTDCTYLQRNCEKSGLVLWRSDACTWAALSLFPYLFGLIHLSSTHQSKEPPIDVLLVQTNFPVEETLGFQTPDEFIKYTFSEWQDILKILSHHVDKHVDLIVLPELVVPYEANLPLFRLETVKASFAMFFGEAAERHLPVPTEHTSMNIKTEYGLITAVNHIYLCQSIADLFDAPVVVGLEAGGEMSFAEKKKYYSSAYVFYPQGNYFHRYDKRVLIPLGEYIPFSFLQKLARKYGVTGSFSPGTEAKVFETTKALIGLSICYEETFGNLMRENRLLGADLLVNLTNDGWYPHSKLPQQHLEHARLRTVETGAPLIRACNTGVTCAVDSYGRNLAVLSDENGNVEDIADALYISFPKENYQTIYTKMGEMPIIAGSLILLLAECMIRRRKRRARLILAKKDCIQV